MQLQLSEDWSEFLRVLIAHRVARREQPATAVRYATDFLDIPARFQHARQDSNLRTLA